MNPYLERLKIKKGLPGAVPKVPQATSGTLGTAPGRAFARNDACAGWPRDDDSEAPFCPWGPYVTPAMLHTWRRELRELVAELATVEGWSDERREQVAHFVERQPGLATLRDDLNYFTERLSEARRGVERSKGWNCEELADRHHCSGCDGSCIGTSKQCTRRA